MGYANSGLGSALLIRDLAEETSTYVYADFAYILAATIFVMIITPGIGLLYSGMVRKKNAIQPLFQCLMVNAIVSITWYLFAYSLACSTTSSSKFLGNFRMGGLTHVDAAPLLDGATIANLLYWVFSSFFPVCAAMIFLGGIAERGNLTGSLILAVPWTTVVYSPLAYWTWNANGWLYLLGDLDFAGGGPVHVASGVASLAYSLYLGKRKEWKSEGKMPHFKGHSAKTSFLGVSLIYFGWLAFNSGTLLAVNVRTAFIMSNTHIAAVFGCLTFAVLDKCITKKWSVMAAADGIIAGLVAITPAAGFVAPYAAAIMGIVTAVVCRLTYNFNEWVGVDDCIYAFNLHGIGGIMGSILTGLFASPNIAGLDGVTEIPGGWIFHHWKQMGYQIAGTVATVAWTFVCTYGLCFLLDKIPYITMRNTEEEEEMGMDLAELAETMDDEFADDASNKGHVSYSSSTADDAHVNQVSDQPHAKSMV